jgi:hypothetical protein
MKLIVGPIEIDAPDTWTADEFNAFIAQLLIKAPALQAFAAAVATNNAAAQQSTGTQASGSAAAPAVPSVTLV